MAFYLNARQTKLLGGLLVLGFLILVWMVSQGSQPSPLQQETNFSSPAQKSLGTSHKDRTTQAKTSDDSSIFLKNFQRRESRQGRLLWEAQGKNARYSPKEERIEIERGYLQFMSEKNGLVEIRSREAILHLQVSALHSALLTGNVRVRLDEKTSITTEKASYNADHHMIHAPGKVHIWNPVIYIEGIGLDADTEARSVLLKKKVRSVLSPQKKRERVEMGEEEEHEQE